jgi:hypothetical protein
MVASALLADFRSAQNLPGRHMQIRWYVVAELIDERLCWSKPTFDEPVGCLVDYRIEIDDRDVLAAKYRQEDDGYELSFEDMPDGKVLIFIFPLRKQE